ncbi:MAG: hypothetical protein N3D17_05215 [bacterium]|nr:hypothetical protein [bacterium]
MGIKFKVKCENCGRPATINTQKVWIKWRYNPATGEYSKNYELLYDIDSACGDENLHFCETCFTRWRDESNTTETQK